MQHNANSITQFFNQWGDKETGRLELTPEDEISLHIHNYFIEKFLPRNSKVLEIGAGPGRFTKKLAQYSTSNVISDTSKVQLNLNRHLHNRMDMTTRFLNGNKWIWLIYLNLLIAVLML